MLSFEEIIKQEPVYISDWDSKFGLVSDFEGINISLREYEADTSPYRNDDYWIAKKNQMSKALEKYKDVNILFAYYLYEDYSGEAFVLFEQDGILYEVNGSHCSCYGLEEQWNPEEVVLVELKHRLIKGYVGGYKNELKKFLGITD